MPPYFRFMTGASSYRIQAKDRDEAIQVALEELRPGEDAKVIILQTLYDEDEGRRFSASEAEEIDEGEVREVPDDAGHADDPA